ncbi:MAG: response regulator, partial [Deltaproteobacteria bacterium]|nr:response regulator [Deltaproteobacteria bacterium]
INLPDIKGGKVYSLIKKSRPDMKVVVCSGRDIDGPVQEVLDAGAEDFIQKPFTFAALSAKVMGAIERRKDNRFNVARGAVVIPEHDRLKQGQIIDISRGGLAFNYNNGKDLTKEFADLAINMVFETYYLDKIPCKIISHGTTGAMVSQNQEKMKRVSLRFGELTQKQTDQLEYFLQNLTTNPI